MIVADIHRHGDQNDRISMKARDSKAGRTKADSAPSAPDRSTDSAFGRYNAAREAFWDEVATKSMPADLSGYYHQRMIDICRNLVRPGKRVAELGSGKGDLLAALKPRRGVGIDLSGEMVEAARRRHPDIEFRQGDAHSLVSGETFDFIILSDLVNDLWDVQAVLENVLGLCDPGTRVVVSFYNKLWQVPLGIARRLGLAKPLLQQNWLSVNDVKNLLRLSGFEVISTSPEILSPIRLPLVTGLFNRFLVKLWPLSHLALSHFVVARPDPRNISPSTRSELTVSVIIPARNEAGHIEGIVARTPTMGAGTELIFVEGNSSDGTYDVIERAVTSRDDSDVRLFRQPGVGKGDAVRHGFGQSTGDVLMILDADMTVAPEELPRFFRAIADGDGEFINGVRLIYPSESQAMQLLNLIGNKFFGLVFTWILRQPVKDTLCGTKVLTRAAYEEIAANRDYFGEFDPFGDFDLLLGAARNHLKIVDMPIRYRQRVYGSTNISRWRHGLLLLKMAAFAARRLRFI